METREWKLRIETSQKLKQNSTKRGVIRIET